MIRHPFEAPPAPGEATEVTPGVLWMRLPLPMALDHVNVYALDEGDGWTLIDSGMSSRRTKAEWAMLMAGPLAGRPIRRVIATHHHPDHIGLAGWFQTDHGAELWTSRTAWLFARMLTLDEHPRPIPQALAFWRRAGMRADLLEKRAGERPFNFADVVAPMPLGFTRLAEGDVVRIGGRDWDVAMGDGHAPEHVTLWSRDGDLVIGGDQLLPGISPNLGVYPTEPGADPVGDWLAATERLAPRATHDQLVLPGHKLPFTGLPFRLRQMTENHRAGLDRLASALADRPRTATGCFDILYRRTIGDGEYGLALVEAVAHLNRLAREGRARIVGVDPTGADLWGG